MNEAERADHAVQDASTTGMPEHAGDIARAIRPQGDANDPAPPR
jgi:hypothetical protein